MSFTVRRVEYFYTSVANQPGEGYQLLSLLAEQGINLLAFNGVPTSPERTQLSLFPEDALKLSSVAKKANLYLDGPYPAIMVSGDDEIGVMARLLERLAEVEINVYAANCIADGRGNYGCIFYVTEEHHEEACRVLEQA